MTAHMPHNPLLAAQHVQAMAGRATDEKLAKVLTGLSVALILMMLVREGRDMLQGPENHGHRKTWQEREDERRTHREHARER